MPPLDTSIGCKCNGNRPGTEGWKRRSDELAVQAGKHMSREGNGITNLDGYHLALKQAFEDCTDHIKEHIAETHSGEVNVVNCIRNHTSAASNEG